MPEEDPRNSGSGTCRAGNPERAGDAYPGHDRRSCNEHGAR